MQNRAQHLRRQNILKSNFYNFDLPFWRRRFATAFATCAPTAALFLTRAIFAVKDSPPVISLMRCSKNGVTSLPFTPLESASATAFLVASSTLAASAAKASGTG